MFKSFNTIYNFIIKTTIITFGVIFTVLCCLLVYFFFDNALWYIPFLILAIVVSILGGSYLFVVLNVPFQLPGKFDHIKNNVALGKYKNLQEFQLEIADFMLGFFSFYGASIVGGKFHFVGCEPLIKDCEVDFSELNKESFKNNKRKLKDDKKAFHLPITLGEEKLGYMIVVTEGYTLPIFYSILNDFEDYYLDDQIRHFVK